MNNRTFMLGVFALALATLLLWKSCVKPNNNCPPCLPEYIHSAYSDSLANVNHQITIENGDSMIERFNTYKQSLINGGLKDSGFDIKNYVVLNREAIYKILKQDSSVGIRIYPALTKNYKLTYVLSAQKFNNNRQSIFITGNSGPQCLIDKVQPPDTIVPNPLETELVDP